MMEDYMLTTDDNPFDPHTQFDAWYDWDNSNGYHTLQYLDRVIITSPELSQADQDLAYNRAINEIIRENGTLYKKVAPTQVGTQ